VVCPVSWLTRSRTTAPRRPQAFESRARDYNYPDTPRRVTAADIPGLGLRAAFASNAFAAWRLDAVAAVGGFPARCIVSEDMHTAARLLRAGWTLAYTPTAEVWHAHDYGPKEYLRRYFDIGVFHAEEPWLRQEFGSAERAGLGLLWRDLRLSSGISAAGQAVLLRAAQWLGYRLGLAHQRLPAGLRSRLSAQRHYWLKSNDGPGPGTR